MSALFDLKPLQQTALDMLRSSLSTKHKRPIIQAATGFGKTVLAAHIVTGALAKRKRVAFVVPLLTLIDQTFERFVENAIDPGEIGVFQGNHPWRRPSAPVQICSVQTIAARGFPVVDFVIIDECHKRFKVIEEWMAEQPDKIFMGLSATPWTKGLADYFDDLLIPAEIDELIGEGYLCPFKVFAPAHPDLSGIKIVAGDYHEGQLSERMSKATVVGDVVQTWLAKARGKDGEHLPTLVFAVDRAHADLLHKQFEASGVASEYVDANTTREERADMSSRFSSGHTDVICSVGTMTHGVDLDVRCIVLARPTKSESLFVQMIGRGLRTADGKDYCLILDHSDSHTKLGMVTDIRHDALKSAKAGAVSKIEPPVRLPIECSSCTFLMPVGVHECPNCGFVRPRVSRVQNESGELIELEIARRTTRKTNRDLTWPEKIQFIGELRGYALGHGYKLGWVTHKYRERFGVWPDDPRLAHGAAREPSMETLSWIKGMKIRWAKSKAKRSDDEILRQSVAGTMEELS